MPLLSTFGGWLVHSFKACLPKGTPTENDSPVDVVDGVSTCHLGQHSQCLAQAIWPPNLHVVQARASSHQGHPNGTLHVA